MNSIFHSFRGFVKASPREVHTGNINVQIFIVQWVVEAMNLEEITKCAVRDRKEELFEDWGPENSKCKDPRWQELTNKNKTGLPEI